MIQRSIRFGVVGCGLMGREFASAAARWCHLEGVEFAPKIVAACDTNPAATDWFEKNVPTVRSVTTDVRELLGNPDVEAIYCAVPHHLHAQIYVDIIESGRHLLGEKPFGIDLKANETINQAIEAHPGVLVRCSSEFPFFPGAYQIATWVRDRRFGRIIDVEAGFWHSSDLNPDKPINWKRQIDTNGIYGCMGDLGMHVTHLPLRFGWMPRGVHALLSNVMAERPGLDGRLVPCETWDNAILACDVAHDGETFPMLLSTKRIAPGHADTWFLRINGTELSAEFSTKNPKELRYLPYKPGGVQAWHSQDMPYASAYPAITGSIFEFGFSDAILQMWAAFCDELVNGDSMKQPLHCVTPREAEGTHKICTAALDSQLSRKRIAVEAG
jgi:predicted dehydrogenase